MYNEYMSSSDNFVLEMLKGKDSTSILESLLDIIKYKDEKISYYFLTKVLNNVFDKEVLNRAINSFPKASLTSEIIGYDIYSYFDGDYRDHYRENISRLLEALKDRLDYLNEHNSLHFILAD